MKVSGSIKVGETVIPVQIDDSLPDGTSYLLSWANGGFQCVPINGDARRPKVVTSGVVVVGEKA